MTYNYYQPHLNIHLKIEKRLLQKTFDAVYKYFPKEFGGIFLGEVTEKTAEVTTILTPTKFDNSETKFKRYSEDLNDKIAEAYEKNNGRIIFLGEWHSHPLNAPVPSSTDYEAMYKLSTHPNISLKTPILLIISYTETKVFSPRFYILFNEKLYPYQRN